MLKSPNKITSVILCVSSAFIFYTNLTSAKSAPDEVAYFYGTVTLTSSDRQIAAERAADAVVKRVISPTTGQVTDEVLLDSGETLTGHDLLASEDLLPVSEAVYSHLAAEIRGRK